MESESSNQITAALLRRVEQGANATHIAEAIVSTWREIDSALTPIIGQKGLAALYQRSLHLASPAYPCLSGMHEGIQSEMDLPKLGSALARQSGVDAAAAAGSLLQIFDELLASLVGPSLTERLLRSVWANSSNGLP